MSGEHIHFKEPLDTWSPLGGSGYDWVLSLALVTGCPVARTVVRLLTKEPDHYTLEEGTL